MLTPFRIPIVSGTPDPTAPGAKKTVPQTEIKIKKIAVSSQ